MDSYEAVIEFLYGRINYERVDAQAYSTSDFKLDRMRLLLSLLGNPQDLIPVVHVAGTKGKGSTCTMIAAVLAAAGQRVGLYISPHISAFEERMTVNSERPSRQELVDLVNRLLPAVTKMDGLPGQMQPTYFELATAIAWLYFTDRQVDLAVLETGLGGRLDSTNICRPRVCMITNISRDHTHILGSTVRQIAWEKAGIIKPHVPLISGVTQPDARDLVQQLCRERDARLIELGPDVQVTARRTSGGDLSGTSANNPSSWVDIRTPRTAWTNLPVALRGVHQATNTAMAVAAIDELRAQGWPIRDEEIRQGLMDVTWPARVEVVSRHPTVVIDAAHNWESARALVTTLREEFSARRRILIFAATRDKDVAGLLRLLIPAFDTIIFTRYLDNPRSVPVQELQMFVHAVSNRSFHIADNPVIAWQMARQWADTNDLIAITGSFFLVAELRDVVINAGEM
ncbi:MAG: bifunctional folylpolyglutamate synthase/dihydrofolate synthase [Planctomycetes bacterium]|nr:bifunctional folylpolyglutamate synthase/dihydrofolate synthase [Planctomycetota bacterium]